MASTISTQTEWDNHRPRWARRRTFHGLVSEDHRTFRGISADEFGPLNLVGVFFLVSM
ncbi:hypothetical protein ABZ622_22195 [Streptomyces sp. NPDC007164]|uniref:hypothetical protein n=1 Tax=Streptomyces sp. NPDC007164 TaxID=3156918 RepID=UPI0033F7E191